MSMTDGPDGNDRDRREAPLYWEPEAADSSSGARSGGQPVGSAVQITQKVLGCGCLVPSVLFLLAGCIALLVIVWGFLLPDWRANHRYAPTSCQVLEKRLDSQDLAQPGPGPHEAKPHQSYRPELKVRYEVAGRKYEVWAYDAYRIYSEDQAAQQAVLDSFQVGSTYPCWYDPDRPEQAVLVRGHAWGAYLFLILPFVFWIVGGVGILIAWKLIAMQPDRVASGGGGVPLEAESTATVFLPRSGGLASPRNPFDPSRLGDPLAMKIEWSPLKRGGLINRSREIVQDDPTRLEFRILSSHLVFALLFLLTAAGVPIAVVIGGVLSGRFSPVMLLALVPVLAAVIAGGWALYLGTTPIVFDRGRGFFWKGRAAPDELANEDALEVFARLWDVHAVQLISERIRSLGGTWERYELNLVLNDGERLGVVAHGELDQLRNEAATLARFLKRPLWDAT